jgi:leucyl aminopeptidase
MNLHNNASLDALDTNTVLVVPFFKHDDLSNSPQIKERGGAVLENAVSRGEATGALYETTMLHPTASGPAILLAGAGERSELQPLTLTRVIAAATRHATGRGWTSVAVFDTGICTPEEWAQATVAGAIHGAYNVGIKKTKSEGKRSLETLSLISQRAGGDGYARAAEVGQITGECANLARDLVNLPPNELTPTALADRAQQLATQYGLQCEVLDEADMRRLGMGSLLGVAAGSHQPPRVIVLRTGDANAAQKVAFVGKGLTFDSGGLSLKTGEGMMTMKSDMGGAAATIAGLVAVARLGVKNVFVSGYVGATENMPGGAAMRPGDVVTAMNGETIEVLNTDAEGRLVLADVLSYAVSQGQTHLVDFATLTGGAVTALGHAATLTAGKPGDWVEKVVNAADRGLDRSWRMPLYSEYRRAMDSEVADIKNVGGRAASALTASAFLADFVADADWAHMDIAGTAFNSGSERFAAEGGTGVGVGTVVALAREFAGE